MIISNISKIFFSALIINIITMQLSISAQEILLTPMPNDIIHEKGEFVLNKESLIIYSSENKQDALRLQNFLITDFSLQLQKSENANVTNNTIRFGKDSSLKEEAYCIQIDTNGIDILANSNAGWFYAVQTIKQLISFNSYFSKYEDLIKLKAITINDTPRFSWRAFMLDEARHFKGKEQVKLLLNEMARLKMNIFHWHLVDDQGWRIEIKKYPRLTEIGSTRKSTQIGPLQWESPIQSGETHEGFYTQDDIKEIIKYASDRHITIVPEIEMPGHSTAAIAAYNWLGTSKKKIEVPTKFGVGLDVYDVADPRVNGFLRDVLDEVIELFPSKIIHIGGDEVKYNHWKSSFTVRKYMKKNNLKTPADLQVFFTNEISKYLESKGKRMMGWNEILGHNLHYYQDEKDTETTQKLASESVIHFWKGDGKLAETAAKNGYEIVNSLHSSTYLDYSYKNLPLSKSYDFNPIPEKLNPKYHNKIIGIGCQMWGEWIPTNGNMHFQVFPRIAAYAEVGWTNIENKNYSIFKKSVKMLQKKWKDRGIYFAPDDFVD